ncbi:MAG TPA: SCO family protein [Anaerolineae bacterium]
MTLLTSCQPLQSLLPPTPTPAPHGVVIDPPKPMPDFTLTNNKGVPTRLSDLQGKYVLMFFGYTHCPDICPLSLGDFKAIKKSLGEDASKVTFVFISVDGSRDTPEVLNNYVNAFDTEFVGLTGDDTEVAKIGINYGVHFEKQKATGSAAAYLVAHTTYSYLLDAQGQWRMVFPFKTPIESVARDIEKELAQAN